MAGSGNLVHNLHTYAWGRHPRDPYDWAVRFERTAKDIMLAGDYKPLVNYDLLGSDAALSIPTPDHYLPLLYVLASRQSNESIRFPVEGVDGGSISMLSVQVG
jgi:4,5-DOPA dioxygenase extradiol